METRNLQYDFAAGNSRGGDSTLQLDYNEYSGAIAPSSHLAYAEAVTKLPLYYRSGEQFLEVMVRETFRLPDVGEVFLVPGADDGIFRWLHLHTLLKELGRARTIRSYHSPTYDHALIFARQLGLQIVGEDEQADLLYLCTPNNPDGAVLSAEDLCALAREFPGQILVDLSYATYGGVSPAEYANCLVRNGVRNCTLVVSGAKMFPLAGLRFGWLMCFTPELSEAFRAHLNPKLLPPIARHLARSCLLEGEFYFQENARVFANRARAVRVLVHFLSLHNIALVADLAGAGNFFRLRGETKLCQRAAATLAQNGILVRAKPHWSFLRITSPGERLFQQMKAILATESM